MAVTHTISASWRTGSGGSKTATVAVTGDTEINSGDLTVAVSDADAAVGIAFAFANLQSLYWHSTGDVTIKTNSVGSPAQTFALKANIPFLWIKNSGIPNPISTDVTSLHVVNASASVAPVVNLNHLLNTVS